MNRLLLTLAALTIAAPAFAQSQADQHLVDISAEPAMAAVRAALGQRDQLIAKLQAVIQAREAAWAEYAKPLWQQPEPTK